MRAVLGPVDGIPVLLPAAGEALVPGILPRLDGLILTGSRSNVCPDHYAGPAHAEGTPEDPARDSTTLPLIRAAIAAGVPLLAICRGFQELNVALGGSLAPAHPGPARPLRPFHAGRPAAGRGCAPPRPMRVRLAPGSAFAKLAGGETLGVNSLHNQGIARLAPRLVAEAWAPDGTIEAVRVRDARGLRPWRPMASGIRLAAGRCQPRLVRVVRSRGKRLDRRAGTWHKPLNKRPIQSRFRE